MPRLFVAVWPPAAVLDELEALPRPDLAGVRWTRRGQWHVTLRFLGEAEAADVVPALDALARSAVAPPVGQVVLGPAVSRLGRSVLCLPAAGLDPLAAAVREATSEIGRPPDPRPFAGHLTLARLRGRGACGVAGTPFRATFTAAEVALVESTPGPGGSRYDTVATWPLRGGEAAARDGS